MCLKFRIRHAFGVSVISWPHKRVDAEECAMVFLHFFGPWHRHPLVCFHFKCGRGFLHAWADVDSKFNDGSDFCCVWQLMWSCMHELRTCVQF